MTGDDSAETAHGLLIAGFDELPLAPTTGQLNKALGQAMRYIAKSAGTGRDGKQLSKAEEKSLAFTWKAVVSAARDFRGWSVQDITG